MIGIHANHQTEASAIKSDTYIAPEYKAISAEVSRKASDLFGEPIHAICEDIPDSVAGYVTGQTKPNRPLHLDGEVCKAVASSNLKEGLHKDELFPYSVISHERQHNKIGGDEAVTECYSRQDLVEALADHKFLAGSLDNAYGKIMIDNYESSLPQYRSDECASNKKLDRTPGDNTFDIFIPNDIRTVKTQPSATNKNLLAHQIK